MVAPYWEDLKGLQDGTGGFLNMRLVTWHDSANNRFIIEWNDAYNRATLTSDNPSLEKFQLILYPNQDQDGDLVVMYHTVDNPTTNTLGNHSTVGIENHTQTVGLTYSFSNEYPASASPLQAGLAVRYTTTAPDPFVHNEQDTNPGIQSSILSQNYPNPFNPETDISFTLSEPSDVKLSVYNTKGENIHTLHKGKSAAGLHTFSFDGSDLTSGVYYYRIETSRGGGSVKKMMLLK
jgi:hypothetical protein